MTSAKTRKQVETRLHPEMAAGGYTRQDGFVNFFDLVLADHVFEHVESNGA